MCAIVLMCACCSNISSECSCSTSERGKNTLPLLGTVALTLHALHNYQNATSHFIIVFRPATLPPAFLSLRNPLQHSRSSRKSSSCICVLTGSVQDWKCTRGYFEPWQAVWESSISYEQAEALSLSPQDWTPMLSVALIFN